MLFKVAGALVAIAVFAGGIYFCGGARARSSLTTGCVAAGHQPTDPLLAKCVEQAKGECSSDDEACAKAVGYKLLGGAPNPPRTP